MLDQAGRRVPKGQAILTKNNCWWLEYNLTGVTKLLRFYEKEAAVKFAKDAKLKVKELDSKPKKV